MDRAELIDAALVVAEDVAREERYPDRDDATRLVDTILDKLIELTGSIYTKDELTRIKNGA